MPAYAFFVNYNPARSLLLHDKRRHFLDNLAHVGDELVAEAGHCLDKLWLVAVRAQRLPEHGNSDGKVSILNRHVMPDGIHQLIAFDQPS